MVASIAAWTLLPKAHEERPALDGKRRYLEQLHEQGPPAATSPNLVLILFDDLGYGDLGCYGSRAISTPNLDRLASEGVRLTHAYATSPYCSASRAGLLTGRYPVRSGLDHVLQPRGTWPDVLLTLGRRNRRLPADEITLAEILSAAGYATAAFGKWHLGDRSPSLPNDLGFDSFYGLLHSNDQGKPKVFENREVVERPPIDQTTLTRRYTERAVDFIEEHGGSRPFFLYVPHTFPHIPLHVSDDRLGRSRGGLYGDVVEELDWSVGEVLAALARTGLDESTLVLVTSDNGPWFQGSSGGTRGRKLDVFEGGMRVPLLARWTGRIEPGVVIDEPVIGLDVLPTVLEVTGIAPPADRKLDGRSLVRLLTTLEPGERELYFFQLGVLRAVRSGRFKYFDRRRIFFGNPMNWPWGPMKSRGPWLFDLAGDPAESYDVSDKHPEEAARLRKVLEAQAREQDENPRGWL